MCLKTLISLCIIRLGITTCHCSQIRLYVSLPARKYVISKWRRNDKQRTAWSVNVHTKNGYEVHQSNISALINKMLEKKTGADRIHYQWRADGWR